MTRGLSEEGLLIEFLTVVSLVAAAFIPDIVPNGRIRDLGDVGFDFSQRSVVIRGDFPQSISGGLKLTPTKAVVDINE